MTPKRGRKLTVLDALALIAAIAIGLAWTRHFQTFEAGFESYPHPEEIPLYLFRIKVFEWWVHSLLHCLAVITVALLLLRLRKPRTRLRSLARQPGSVACGAVLLALLGEYLWFFIDRAPMFRYGKLGHSLEQLIYFSIDGHDEGVAVAAVWLLLAISGRWRREPGWIDGMGIAVGMVWLIHPLFQQIIGLLFQFLRPTTSTGFPVRVPSRKANSRGDECNDPRLPAG